MRAEVEDLELAEIALLRRCAVAAHRRAVERGKASEAARLLQEVQRLSDALLWAQWDDLRH